MYCSKCAIICPSITIFRVFMYTSICTCTCVWWLPFTLSCCIAGSFALLGYPSSLVGRAPDTKCGANGFRAVHGFLFTFLLYCRCAFGITCTCTIIYLRLVAQNLSLVLQKFFVLFFQFLTTSHTFMLFSLSFKKSLFHCI